MNQVRDGLDRLEGIVDDLPPLATIESNLDRTREEVDLTALVETVAAQWDESDDVRLDLDLSPSTCWRIEGRSTAAGRQ
jgi:hypothetical protein